MARSFPTFFSFISLPFGTPATSEGPAQFAYSGKSLDFANIGEIVIVMLSGFKHRQVLSSKPLGCLFKLAETHSFFPWYCLKLLHASYVSSVMSNSSEPTRFLCPLDSPGKNTGVHCHALLQGSNPPLLHLLYWQLGSLPLAPPGKSPRRTNIRVSSYSCCSTSTTFFWEWHSNYTLDIPVMRLSIKVTCLSSPKGALMTKLRPIRGSLSGIRC